VRERECQQCWTHSNTFP